MNPGTVPAEVDSAPPRAAACAVRERHREGGGDTGLVTRELITGVCTQVFYYPARDFKHPQTPSQALSRVTGSGRGASLTSSDLFARGRRLLGEARSRVAAPPPPRVRRAAPWGKGN